MHLLLRAMEAVYFVCDPKMHFRASTKYYALVVLYQEGMGGGLFTWALSGPPDSDNMPDP